MKIVKIEPKDIYVTIEMSLSDIERVITALDHAEINFDHAKDIKASEASNYLCNTFYPNLKEVVEDLANGDS